LAKEEKKTTDVVKKQKSHQRQYFSSNEFRIKIFNKLFTTGLLLPLTVETW
jgi:hypothetical protein